MTSDRFARVETLYHAARARSPEERGAYLAEACGGDDDLRRDVESLLKQQGVGVLTSVAARPALASGTLIGTYRIVEQIGAGGMGEVYRAHDTKLARDVALKVLPQALAADPDRLARLEREARLLASLSHANIAHVYGLEESSSTSSGQGPTRALVMELAQGKTLADRIARGPMPIDESLAIARQIASALAAAHDHGIIHRDLKPANVKVGPDGTVKVLDFGLAKAMDTVVSPGETESGAIVGTPAYMSPEQASAKPVDRRTDLWAFGVVLMEMLTGRRVFDGDSTAHVLSAVLKSDPDWSSLPVNTSAGVRQLLRHCLTKDPTHRWDSAAAAQLQLSGAADPAAERSDGVTSRRRSWRYAVLGAAAVLLAAVVAGEFLSGGTTRGPSVRFIVQPEPGSVMGGINALSPNGQWLAFVASIGGESGIWLRDLTRPVATPIPGTQGTSNTFFWSPDSRWIAFFAHGKLRRVAPTGGVVETLCCDNTDLETLFNRRQMTGGAWSRDGDILLGGRALGIIRIAPNATRGTVIVQPPPGGQLFQPEFLPDGRHFLYVSVAKSPRDSGLFASAIDGAPPKRLTNDLSRGVFADGRLLFVRNSVLIAQSFDPDRLELRGDPSRSQTWKT